MPDFEHQEEEDPNAPVFQMQVPEALETGVYANFMAIWHSPHDFTLDFAVTGQPIAPGEDDGTDQVTVPCTVVARVKIPLTVAEDMLRAMATNISRYEETAGRIHRPGEDRPGSEGRT